MHQITPEHYRILSEKLLETIAEADFYNGSITLDNGPFEAILRATLIIKRVPAHDPTDRSQSVRKIVDIVPVWWEYHLCDITGERLSDFDWREFKKYLD